MGAGASPTLSSSFSFHLLLFFAQISQRVHLVLSVSTDTGLGQTLEQSQGAHVVALGPLEPSARAQLVREELALYGKRLEESPFNNQVGCRRGLEGVWPQGAEAASCPRQPTPLFLRNSVPGEAANKITGIPYNTSQPFPPS